MFNLRFHYLDGGITTSTTPAVLPLFSTQAIQKNPNHHYTTGQRSCSANNIFEAQETGLSRVWTGAGSSPFLGLFLLYFGSHAKLLWVVKPGWLHQLVMCCIVHNIDVACDGTLRKFLYRLIQGNMQIWTPLPCWHCTYHIIQNNTLVRRMKYKRHK